MEDTEGHGSDQSWGGLLRNEAPLKGSNYETQRTTGAEVIVELKICLRGAF